MQDIAGAAHRFRNEGDEVFYYVNIDFAGWVEQRVRRRVYIELKLECTRNRSRDVQKTLDDWICCYCKAFFPSKLRLTDHRVVGCPRGPVDSSGAKYDLPVYPNLKTAKQGKDLKLALERGDGSIWDNLQDKTIWLELNPALREPTLPPAGARVQQRLFLEPSVEWLAAGPERTPKAGPSATAQPSIVDLDEDTNDDDEAPRPHSRKRAQADMGEERPRKRTTAGMDEGHGVFHSPQQ